MFKEKWKCNEIFNWIWNTHKYRVQKIETLLFECMLKWKWKFNCLVEHRANINKEDNNWETPSFNVIFNGNKKIVNHLTEHTDYITIIYLNLMWNG